MLFPLSKRGQTAGNKKGGGNLRIKKNDAYIQVKLPSELKKAAEKKLSEMGYSISEFVREKLREVVEEEEKKNG